MERNSDGHTGLAARIVAHRAFKGAVLGFLGCRG